ncbi:hypothetical protein J7E70_33405 [Variovorax paradoxus]|nr:hypothetical protein [Variovorax paradoxus]MBT2305302.1 hypothetical protein [Variovorax paradoxus]
MRASHQIDSTYEQQQQLPLQEAASDEDVTPDEMHEHDRESHSLTHELFRAFFAYVQGTRRDVRRCVADEGPWRRGIEDGHHQFMPKLLFMISLQERHGGRLWLRQNFEAVKGAASSTGVAIDSHPHPFPHRPRDRGQSAPDDCRVRPRSAGRNAHDADEGRAYRRFAIDQNRDAASKSASDPPFQAYELRYWNSLTESLDAEAALALLNQAIADRWAWLDERPDAPCKEQLA